LKKAKSLPRLMSRAYAASSKVLPSFEIQKKELASRLLIREQAFGEALGADKLEGLGR
jgi:hypothetical protein